MSQTGDSLPESGTRRFPSRELGVDPPTPEPRRGFRQRVQRPGAVECGLSNKAVFPAARAFVAEAKKPLRDVG